MEEPSDHYYRAYHTSGRGSVHTPRGAQAQATMRYDSAGSPVLALQGPLPPHDLGRSRSSTCSVR